MAYAVWVKQARGSRTRKARAARPAHLHLLNTYCFTALPSIALDTIEQLENPLRASLSTRVVLTACPKGVALVAGAREASLPTEVHRPLANHTQYIPDLVVVKRRTTTVSLPRRIHKVSFLLLSARAGATAFTVVPGRPAESLPRSRPNMIQEISSMSQLWRHPVLANR